MNEIFPMDQTHESTATATRKALRWRAARTPMLALSLLMGACSPVADVAPASPERDQALQALTPAAAAVEGGVDHDASGAMGDPSGSVSPGGAPDARTTPPAQSEAPVPSGDAILTQVAAMNLDSDVAAPMLTQAAESAAMAQVGGGSEEGLGVGEGDAAFKATQAAIDVEAGIANVDLLISSMPPLATFTPPAKAPAIDGKLVYLRNGRFFEKSADGSVSDRLDIEDSAMPSVWAPPDDPGRAWLSPDGTKMGFLAGRDAAVWVMDTNGRNNREIFANVLPDEKHTVSVGSASRDVTMFPGSDYTVIYTPGSDEDFGVLVDNNEYHISGEGRVRIVHAANRLSGNNLVVRIDGTQIAGQVRYGYGAPEERIPVGAFNLVLQNQNGEELFGQAGLQVGEKEVKSFFLWGDNDLTLTEVPYLPGTRPASGKSRVRFFNGGTAPIDVSLDGRSVPTGSVAPGSISNYIEVEGTLSKDAREDFEISIYGLRPGEDPITWAPTSDAFAFLAGPEGVIDLFLAPLDGEAIRLTQDARRETNPVWSPDGRSLAWVSVDETYGEVAVWTLPGLSGTPTELDVAPIRAAAGGAAADKVAFPEGIAWASNELLYLHPVVNNASAGIWTYDPRSAALNQLWTGVAENPKYSLVSEAWAFHEEETGVITVLRLDGTSRVIVEGDGFFPEWAPDGTTLTYGLGQPISSDGWEIHAIDADGDNDRALTARLPLMQESPPVPGPNVKRFWIDDDTMIFSRVGHDYGLKDRAGVTGQVEAGPDIENFFTVDLSGRSAPAQLTDLMKVFYMRDVAMAPDGEALAFIAFAYNSRGQQLFTVPAEGGKPVKIDGPVRWYAWVE